MRMRRLPEPGQGGIFDSGFVAGGGHGAPSFTESGHDGPMNGPIQWATQLRCSDGGHDRTTS